MKIRYALASGTRSLDVYVNGTKAISNSAFTATGSWTSWGEKTIQVLMNTGTKNEVRIGWKLGGKEGMLQGPDVAPRGAGR